MATRFGISLVRAAVVTAWITAAGASWAMAGQDLAAEVDRLYSNREDPGSARQAADIWADALKRDPADFEAAWKLARVRYWIATHSPAGQKDAQFQLGIDAAEAAVAARPTRPEGHFWLASNIGSRAEAGGMWTGLRSRNRIREEFEETVRLDSAFDGGAAHAALGSWYLRVPGFMGGSKVKSEEHLRQALKHDPDSIIAHYFLAETLIETDRVTEARAELQKALDAPLLPEFTPEGREWKQKAKQLLDKLGSRR